MREGGTAEGWVFWEQESEDYQWMGGIPSLLARCVYDRGLELAMRWEGTIEHWICWKLEGGEDLWTGSQPSLLAGITCGSAWVVCLKEPRK